MGWGGTPRWSHFAFTRPRGIDGAREWGWGGGGGMWIVLFRNVHLPYTILEGFLFHCKTADRFCRCSSAVYEAPAEKWPLETLHIERQEKEKEKNQRNEIILDPRTGNLPCGRWKTCKNCIVFQQMECVHRTHKFSMGPVRAHRSESETNLPPTQWCLGQSWLTCQNGFRWIWDTMAQCGRPHFSHKNHASQTEGTPKQPLLPQVSTESFPIKKGMH